MRGRGPRVHILKTLAIFPNSHKKYDQGAIAAHNFHLGRCPKFWSLGTSVKVRHLYCCLSAISSILFLFCILFISGILHGGFKPHYWVLLEGPVLIERKDDTSFRTRAFFLFIPPRGKNPPTHMFSYLQLIYVWFSFDYMKLWVILYFEGSKLYKSLVHLFFSSPFSHIHFASWTS